MTNPNGPNSNAFDWPVDPARIDRNWRAISIELDAPRPGRLERFLRFFGMPSHITRLMVATPALRRAWFLATGLAILIGLGATDGDRPRADLFVLLTLAPLIPVLGVSMAYGSQADPAHEASLATPLRGLRLIATRAATVLGFSIVLLSIAALLTPGVQLMAFAWLLPSFALTATTVALMSFTTPRRAASIAAVVWVVGVTVARGPSGDPLAAFTAGGQFLMMLVLVAAVAVAALRRDRFDLLGVTA